MLFKLGLLFNGFVAAASGSADCALSLAPAIRARKTGYESWLSLGALEQFPTGQTRLATYRNPVVNSLDGETADIPCWVRNVDGQNFQVFAINCAHLGCPVRWFPQSNLLCVRVMAARTTRMVLVPPALRSAVSSNTATRLRMENCSSRLAKCRHRSRSRKYDRREENTDARDRNPRELVRSAA